MRQCGVVLKEEGDQANSLPHDEVNELMGGMKGIDVAEGRAQELLPVYGPDGMQQRVSMGTNMISEGEPSVGVFPYQVASISPKLKAVDHGVVLMKNAGPS
jgi:hypothetical protein